MSSSAESSSSSTMAPWLTNACRSFTSLRARQVTGTHLLRIDGYSTANRMVQQGESIESRTFTAGGHKWRLRFFPNGYDDGEYVAGVGYVPGSTATAGELELMKRSNDDDDNVVAAYGLSVLGRDGEPELSYTVGPQRFNRRSSYKHRVAVLVTPEERQAALRLVEADDDSLAVRCDLTVTRFYKESLLKFHLRKLLD